MRLLIACSQDRLLPQSISLRLPLFTDELDTVQQYFLMLVGAYKKLGKFPAISKQTKECKQKSEQEQRGNMKKAWWPQERMLIMACFGCLDLGSAVWSGS